MKQAKNIIKLALRKQLTIHDIVNMNAESFEWSNYAGHGITMEINGKYYAIDKKMLDILLLKVGMTLEELKHQIDGTPCNHASTDEYLIYYGSWNVSHLPKALHPPQSDSDKIEHYQRMVDAEQFVESKLGKNYLKYIVQGDDGRITLTIDF